MASSRTGATTFKTILLARDGALADRPDDRLHRVGDVVPPRKHVHEAHPHAYLQCLSALFDVDALCADFATSEPRSFLANSVAISQRSGHIFDAVVSVVTFGIMSPHTARFLSVVPANRRPAGVSAINHQHALLKLYTLRPASIPPEHYAHVYQLATTALMAPIDADTNAETLLYFHQTLFKALGLFEAVPESWTRLHGFIWQDATIDQLQAIHRVVRSDFFLLSGIIR